ncbi:toxin glutamine deamidase domain-containing protein [Streptomyces sp. NPDC052225]|uniref:toxin glutamine deamidase domain-containing protein n=1 Tax=Streptomyces sp. NPDC052225 TaxID=3154949 RepID=UPI00342F26AB
MRVPVPADPAERTTEWLQEVYGGLAELATPRPVCETGAAWMMSCRTLAQPGFPRTPMLAASVVVPKVGGYPFHPAPSDPFADLQAVPPQQSAERITGQARRINARGCIAAVHSGVNGCPSVALPWQPAHEAPGWWARLRHRYFADFENVSVHDWDDVVRAVEAPGPDTRAVIWVRRAVGGHEVTGNLIYGHNRQGQVDFVDGVTASRARLDTQWVREVVLARALPGAARGAHRCQ